MLKKTVQSYKKSKLFRTKLLNTLYKKQAGVFVTLKKHGELRGCIGTTFPVQTSIGAEILHNAISAGLEDPRFDSVSIEELPSCG